MASAVPCSSTGNNVTSAMTPSSLLSPPNPAALSVVSRPGVAAKTLEILWHFHEDGAAGDESDRGGANVAIRKETVPVCDVAFHPCTFAPDGTMNPRGAPAGPNDRLRLATVGENSDVRIWEMNSAAAHTFLFSTGIKGLAHAMANIAVVSVPPPSCIKWSPNGLVLAVGLLSGGVKLFRRADHQPHPQQQQGSVSFEMQEYRSLSGLTSYVTDLAFSPDSVFVAASAHMGAVAVYDLESPTRSGHVWFASEMHSYCNALAFDPWGRLLASYGSDPELKVSVYREKAGGKVDVSRERKSAAGIHVRGSFAATLRMGFSPDGMLLAVPFGKSKEVAASPRCVYIYTRDCIEKPIVRLGQAENKASPMQGCAWAPGYFEPLPTTNTSAEQHGGRGGGGEGEARLPWGPYKEYRMALAVWNEDSVIIYTTDTVARYAFFNNLHSRPITNVSWSPCARYLLVSSLDCFVSLVYLARPIGPFHASLLDFAPQPSVLRLLGEKYSEMAARGLAIETKVAGSRIVVNEVTAVAVKKKSAAVATPAAPAAGTSTAATPTLAAAAAPLSSAAVATPTPEAGVGAENASSTFTAQKRPREGEAE